jgi:vancomycin permeability regulator SanA
MRDAGAAPPLRRWLKRTSALLLLGLAYVAGANAYVVASTRAAIRPGVDAAPVRPNAIVLGNRVFPGGAPCAELAARLETARALYLAGRAGQIVVSGAVAGDYDEPHAMAAWLEARGVKAADVVLDLGGHRTAATMADAAALGVRSALVVTQDYHLPRSLYLARRAGIDAVGVPAPTARGGAYDTVKVFCREAAARAEIVLEVALRGVRA